MNPIYVIVQEFLKIEAVGTWGSSNGIPTDPIRINAYVTPSSDLSTTIESRDTDKIQDKDALYRVNNGRWAIKLTPGLYTAGLKYTVNFRFWATPGNVNVVRQNFIWDPVSEQPRQEGCCIVFGTLMDVSGLPVSNAELVVETYENFVTLNQRKSQVSVRTNAFGLWSIEMPIDSTARFVFGNVSKVVKIPSRARAALFELEVYQPTSSNHDKFGYPFPSGDKAP